MRLILKAAYAVLVLSVSAQAADETVVVVGTRIPTTFERFGGAATVITAADIRLHQYRDISDALTSVPGLHLASSGGIGALTSVFIRGAESNHVLVIIDGVEVTDPASFNTFGFEHLQLNNIERIEILRGPYSAQYGSEGIGGVINITTKRGEGAPTASARIETGSFESNAAAMNLSGRHGRVDFSFGGAWLETDGESFTPRRLRGGRRGEDDGYDNFDLKGTIGVEVGDTSRLDLSFGYVDAQTEYDVSAPFELSTPRSSVDEKRYGVRWSGDYLKGLWQPSLHGTYYSRDFNDVGFESRGERRQFAWQNDLFFSDAMKLVVGAETELEKARESKSARTNAAYIQAWFEPSDALSLSGGWRNDDADDFGSKRSWQFAAAYALGESGVRLRTSYGTAFKAPSLSERFGFGGNPDLKPETGRGWEIGIDQKLAADDFLSSAGWGVAYFNNRIRNLIGYDFVNNLNFNVASSRIEGIESFAFLDTVVGLGLRFDHTVMRAYDGDHDRLLRRPLRKATLAARWSDPLWSLTAKLDYVGPQRDIRRDSGSLTTKGGYTLMNVSARRRLNDRLALFARVNNLLDRDYEPVDGYAGRGVELHAGVEVGL